MIKDVDVDVHKCLSCEGVVTIKVKSKVLLLDLRQARDLTNLLTIMIGPSEPSNGHKEIKE